jgi:hypothetical protein
LLNRKWNIFLAIRYKGMSGHDAWSWGKYPVAFRKAFLPLLRVFVNKMLLSRMYEPKRDEDTGG